MLHEEKKPIFGEGADIWDLTLFVPIIYDIILYNYNNHNKTEYFRNNRIDIIHL